MNSLVINSLDEAGKEKEIDIGETKFEADKERPKKWEDDGENMAEIEVPKEDEYYNEDENMNY